MANEVRFKCKCGTVLGSTLYGQRVKCANCLSILIVPSPQNQNFFGQPAKFTQPINQTHQPQPRQFQAQQSFPALQQPSHRSYTQKTTSGKSNTGLWIGIGVVSAVLLVGAIGAAVFLIVSLGNRESRVVQNDGGDPNSQSNNGVSFPGSSEGVSSNTREANVSASSNRRSKSSGNDQTIGVPINYDLDKVSLHEYNIKLPYGMETVKTVENNRGFSYTWRGNVKIDQTSAHYTLNAGKNPNGGHFDAQEMSDYLISKLDRNYTDIDVPDVVEVTINGLTYLKQEWSGIDKRHFIRLKGVNYTTCLRDEVMTISLMTGEKHFEKDEIEFNKYLNSYRLKQ